MAHRLILRARLSSWRAVQVLAWGLLLLASGCGSSPLRPATLALADLEGRTAAVELPEGTRAAVFVFLGVECPIANRCAPELAVLETRLAPQGIRFFHIYPNADETPDAIRHHRTEHGLGPMAYRDPGLVTARRLGARWTPEAVALAPDGRLIYQGRINDQYTALGVGRPTPTRHDLAEALDGFLAGKAPAGITTPRVGCTFRQSP